MSRQIKFRAWDNQRKSFVKSDYFAIGLDGTLIQHNICYNNDPDDTWDDSWNEELDDEKYVIQQFTGLLDKNGKEIYEGDKVSFRRANTDSALENHIGVVAFEEGQYVYVINNWQKIPLSDWTYWQNHREVVGNIFE